MAGALGADALDRTARGDATRPADVAMGFLAAVDFLAAGFFAVVFLATGFFAVVFLATGFFAVVFLATGFLAVVFLATGFVAVVFLAAVLFRAAVFFAVVFFAGTLHPSIGIGSHVSSGIRPPGLALSKATDPSVRPIVNRETSIGTTDVATREWRSHRERQTA